MKYLNMILLTLCILGGQARAKEPILEIEDLDFDKIKSHAPPSTHESKRMKQMKGGAAS